MNVELLQHLGNLDQIAGISSYQFMDGNAKGIKAVEMYNAAGLRLSIMVDKCLDIYNFSFRGINFAFHTKNGQSNRFYPAKDEFYCNWPGGMLATCGLSNVGNACYDNGWHPIHGRIGSIPAQHLSVSETWHDNDLVLAVAGDMHETRLYGRHLVLSRTLQTTLYAKKIEINDTITNYGNDDEALMLLYHINIGYPLLDSNSIFLSSSNDCQRRVARSEDGNHMGKPEVEPINQSYLYSFPGDTAHACIWNPVLHVGCYIDFRTKYLPYLTEWKHLAAHDYVVAMEPGNCLGLGRKVEKENSTLQSIGAYESISLPITLGVLDGDDDFQMFCRNYC